MTEEKEKEKEEIKITWIDGIACYDLPQKPVIRRKIPGRIRPVNHPFNFGWLQEQRTRAFMPDIMDELNKFFNTSDLSHFPPNKWKVFKIDENGKITEVNKEEEKEEEENDN